MPRFVVLEHRWDGVHWDFMLEVEGALKTWAIDLPIRPGTDLPARRLADHRLAYLAYEGEISGGRGSVVRLDRGAYELQEWSDTLIVVEVWGGRFLGSVILTAVEDQSAGGAVPAGWSFRLDEGKLD